MGSQPMGLPPTGIYNDGRIVETDQQRMMVTPLGFNIIALCIISSNNFSFKMIARKLEYGLF